MSTNCALHQRAVDPAAHSSLCLAQKQRYPVRLQLGALPRVCALMHAPQAVPRPRSACMASVAMTRPRHLNWGAGRTQQARCAAPSAALLFHLECSAAPYLSLLKLDRRRKQAGVTSAFTLWNGRGDVRAPVQLTVVRDIYLSIAQSVRVQLAVLLGALRTCTRPSASDWP